MKYKKSIYNEIFNLLEDEKQLLFNYYTGSIVELDKESYIFYQSLQDEFEFDLGSENFDYYEIMNENKLILPIEVDEIKTIDFLSNLDKFNEKTLTLTIAPTLDCNMRCPYCYEESNNVNHISMTEDVKEDILDFIKERVNHLNLLYIVWYGGEPLLEKETIFELSSEIVKICKENNVQYYSSIISNGTLLDYKTAQKLRNDCHITNCQITIDGTKDINDRRRIMRDGTGSFDRIVKNIDSSKELLKIMIRVNVDKSNLEDIPNLVSFFESKVEWNGKVNYYFEKVDDFSIEKSCQQSNLINNQELLVAITNANNNANLGTKQSLPLEHLL